MTKLEFEAYIFDLDGTLVQTNSSYPYNILKKTINNVVTDLENNNIQHNIQEVEYSAAEEFWFCSTERNSFLKEFIKICPRIFWNEFHKLDKKHLEECQRKNIPYVFAYSDVYVLNILQKNGAKLGVVTNTGGYTINYKSNEIKKEGGATFNSIIEANEEKKRAKPNPRGLSMCLNELGCEPEEACYVGDLAVDIQMAQAAGVFDILIDRGRAKIPKEVNPTRTIRSLTELL